MRQPGAIAPGLIINYKLERCEKLCIFADNNANNNANAMASNTITIYATSPNQRFVDQAADTLRNGGIIVYPTDTLYALGCDALNKNAIQRLCRLKGLDPERNLLSVVCSGIGMAAEYARIDNTAFRMLKQHLPGPFTFILPASTRLPKVFKNRKTVGIRIPDNAIAAAISEALGGPILTTSVNVGAFDSAEDATNAEAIAQVYGRQVDLIVDGGQGGTTPSAIVDLATDGSDSPTVLREGPRQIQL